MRKSAGIIIQAKDRLNGHQTITRRINEMQISVYEENGLNVVAPSGKIDHVTVAEFDGQITKLMQKSSKLLLDMKDVEYVSSAALRSILNANDQLTENGGSFTIRNVNNKVMEIFNITGFADYLDIV